MIKGADIKTLLNRKIYRIIKRVNSVILKPENKRRIDQNIYLDMNDIYYIPSPSFEHILYKILHYNFHNIHLCHLR